MGKNRCHWILQSTFESAPLLLLPGHSHWNMESIHAFRVTIAVATYLIQKMNAPLILKRTSQRNVQRRVMVDWFCRRCSKNQIYGFILHIRRVVSNDLILLAVIDCLAIAEGWWCCFLSQKRRDTTRVNHLVSYLVISAPNTSLETKQEAAAAAQVPKSSPCSICLLTRLVLAQSSGVWSNPSAVLLLCEST